jgi:anti-anti-sigma factor
MAEHFSVELHRGERATVVTVSGELDLASTPLLERELARAVEEWGNGVIIADLEKLEFIDSTGLSVLVKVDQQIREAGGRFGVVGGGSQVRRLLDLTGVAKQVASARTVDELLDDG